MDRLPMWIFAQHTEEQAAFAVGAYEQIATADGNTIWYYLQAVLNSAANVSKLLWGSKGKRADQRAELRALLEVPDDSVLRPTSLRNSYEHLDERIDLWYSMPAPHFYVDRGLGPIKQHVRIGGTKQTESFFRLYDPATGQLSFWGDAVNLHELARELRTLRDTANRVVKVLADRAISG